MQPPQREKALNAPWVVLLIVAVLLGLFAIQSQIVGVDVWNRRFGLNGTALSDGGAWRLISYMGAHASWMHAGGNAIGVLAFGTPLARRLGDSPRGGLAYLAFFLIGGALTGLIYLMAHPGMQAILVGASGGVFVLIGAATRLMAPGHRLEPLLSRRVLTMTAVWVGTNLLVAIIGADPATGTRGVAWDAHLIGLALGLVFVGPWLRLFAPRPAPAPAGDPDSVGGPWGAG